jgi:hypothetical protein
MRDEVIQLRLTSCQVSLRLIEGRRKPARQNNCLIGRGVTYLDIYHHERPVLHVTQCEVWQHAFDTVH